jgi:hypothetical protein
MRTSAALILLTLTSVTGIAGQAPARPAPNAAVAPVAPTAPNAPVVIETPNEAARIEWEKRIAQMIRHGQLKLREEQISPDHAKRDQWFVQLYKGVPVIGAEVWRQLEAQKTIALDGTFYTGIDLNPVPKLTRLEAQDALAAQAPDSPGPSLPPTLGILPRPDGSFVLVYQGRVFANGTVTLYSLDAKTGAVVQSDVDPGVGQN